MNEKIKLIHGDSLVELTKLPECSVDSIVTDPPYELGFMGKSWDSTGIANNVDLWKECLRVLKPGGHLLAFSGTRTYHRIASAIEDAGFEVRDMIEWVYGSGFPKSLNIGKAVDKLNGRFIEERIKLAKYIRETRVNAGITSKELNAKFGYVAGCNWWESTNPNNNRVPTKADWTKLRTILNLNDEFNWIIDRQEAEREIIGKTTRGNAGFSNEQVPRPWKEKIGDELDITKGTSEYEGWGTALKPAHEPICMARKPLAEKTVAENCLKYGTGGINIDESRVGTEERNNPQAGFVRRGRTDEEVFGGVDKNKPEGELTVSGRFPANLIHDNSEEVMTCFPENKSTANVRHNKASENTCMSGKNYERDGYGYDDSGNASRFFKSILYYPKTSKSERNAGCKGLEEKELENHSSTFSVMVEDGIVTNKRTDTKRTNNHPTVKPIALMEYLIKMVTPKGGTVLDPFMGSGSTGCAAIKNGFNFIGVDLTEEYLQIAQARINHYDQPQQMTID